MFVQPLEPDRSWTKDCKGLDGYFGPFVRLWKVTMTWLVSNLMCFHRRFAGSDGRAKPAKQMAPMRAMDQWIRGESRLQNLAANAPTSAQGSGFLAFLGSKPSLLRAVLRTMRGIGPLHGEGCRLAVCIW